MPPVSQTLPGRSKKYARRKEADENCSQKSSHTQTKAGGIRLRKKGAIMKCSGCEGVNHNIRGCPSAKDKREREIPAAHEINASSGQVKKRPFNGDGKGKKLVAKRSSKTNMESNQATSS
ncbi:RNA-binding (RRM/RBD/RNP motifs) family proteinwith retrovirus zinc finger-like domain [Striga asiatica]|uniref:RNA-binding (RRM/RBD/RNP motifs) family proteinwith retrovirus zinc finger-like domain n=1 Tax=Striga asiatica TaxID=4170 RepID=A0A5A7QYB2_STRAF|nr:RNA-binding (RRM/RBD/RNP motifs) family proteinwith retrovirus zinc finger-like domain [Striga asiatica]